jgi:Mn-containing catalase
MANGSADELLVEELRGLHHAQCLLSKELPHIAKSAASHELRETFHKQYEETRLHIDRLDECFDVLGTSRHGRPCAVMESLIEDWRDVLDEIPDHSVRDLALVLLGRRIKHDEIARYSTLSVLAKALGRHEVSSLLDESLEEARAADGRLCGVLASLSGAPDGGAEAAERNATSAGS